MANEFRVPSPFVRRDGRPVLSGLTLICCCSGWGKTAFLAQLGQDNPHSVCVSLNPVDDSAKAVLDMLGADNADGVLDELSGKGLLLVDNADSVNSPDGCEILRRLAEAAAQGQITAVFAARRFPKYLLPFVVDGRAEVWGMKELRFTSEEACSLAAQLNPKLTESDVDCLNDFTGGWCVATAALLREGVRDVRAAADNSCLMEYIEGLILDELPDTLKKRFLQSALLQGDEAFYRDGLGIPDMQAALCRLSRMGLVQRDGDSFSCSGLMRHLLSRLLSQEEQTALTERASDYYIRSKRFAEAIRLFEVSGNAAAAERLLCLYGDRLLKNCEFELIGYCGKIIGEAGNVTEPAALGALAQYDYYVGEYEKMEQAFNRADSMFGKENKYSVLRMLYNGLLRFERKPALYEANVRSAVDWLKQHDERMPFLYRRELDILERITKQAPPSEGENKLYVQQFGGLRLTAGHEHGEIQCKTKRSAELIAYMLEHGGKPVGRDELLNAFWHENMPQNAVAMLHNMIYHLRRELSAYGLENIISYKNKYYSLDDNLIAQEDKEIFNICRAVESGNDAALSEYDRQLRTYWGSYLGTLDSLWINEKREYYDRCFVNACTSLAGQYRDEERYEDAAALFRNAYRLDPFSEQLTGELIHCYAALGQPDQARRCYEEYAERLDREFGTRPGKWLRNCFFSCFAQEA